MGGINIRLILVVAGSVVLSSIGQAGGTVSAESGAIRNLTSAMNLFAREHDGRPPTNWTDIGKYIDLDDLSRMLRKNNASPIQAHYVFLKDGTVPILHDSEGFVSLIRTTPVNYRDERGEGRYFVSREKGVFAFNWLPENQISKMLAAAGVEALPEPEAGAVSESGILLSPIPWLVAGLTVIGVVGFLLAWSSRRRRT